MGNVAYAPQAMPQPAAGIPHPDRLVTRQELYDLRKELTDGQNKVNQVFASTAEGLYRNTEVLRKAAGVNKTDMSFKLPGRSHFLLPTARPAKVMIMDASPAVKFVAKSSEGQRVYDHALIEFKEAGLEAAHEIAMGLAEDADEQAGLAAAKFIVADKTVEERKEAWNSIQAARADPKFIVSDELKAKISHEHKTPKGKINANATRKLLEHRKIWGFIETSADPMDWEGRKDAFMAWRAQHGFPVDEAWDGTVDWSLHRDK